MHVHDVKIILYCMCIDIAEIHLQLDIKISTSDEANVLFKIPCTFEGTL